MFEENNLLKTAINSYFKKNRLNPLLASKLMGKTPQFVRIGLQKGILPIGTAIKNGKWNYYISPKLFENYTGINIKDGIEKILKEEF